MRIQILNSTDSAHIGPVYIPTKFAQLYPYLSDSSDHPLNDTGLRKLNTLASQNNSYKELRFLTAQSTAFISEKQYRHNSHPKYQPASYAKVTSFAKIFGKKSETENVNDQSNEFQRLLDTIKKVQEVFEPYRASFSDSFDIETLKKILHGYYARYTSCTNLQLSLQTMQHPPCDRRAPVTSVKQFFTLNFPSKMTLKTLHYSKNYLYVT